MMIYGRRKKQGSEVVTVVTSLVLGVALLLTSACTFQTEAIDDLIGTSCGYFELNRLQVSSSHACWTDQNASGSCFASTDGACGGQTRKTFLAGEEVALWCPLGNAGEQHPFVPVECEKL